MESIRSLSSGVDDVAFVSGADRYLISPCALILFAERYSHPPPLMFAVGVVKVPELLTCKFAPNKCL